MNEDQEVLFQKLSLALSGQDCISSTDDETDHPLKKQRTTVSDGNFGPIISTFFDSLFRLTNTQCTEEDVLLCQMNRLEEFMKRYRKPFQSYLLPTRAFHDEDCTVVAHLEKLALVKVMCERMLFHKDMFVSYAAMNVVLTLLGNIEMVDDKQLLRSSALYLIDRVLQESVECESETNMGQVMHESTQFNIQIAFQFIKNCVRILQRESNLKSGDNELCVITQAKVSNVVRALVGNWLFRKDLNNMESFEVVKCVSKMLKCDLFSRSLLLATHEKIDDLLVILTRLLAIKTSEDNPSVIQYVKLVTNMCRMSSFDICHSVLNSMTQNNVYRDFLSMDITEQGTNIIQVQDILIQRQLWVLFMLLFENLCQNNIQRAGTLFLTYIADRIDEEALYRKLFKLFGGDDSVLISVLNYLLSFYISLAEVVDFDKIAMISPHRTLMKFLSYIDFQHSILLEYLISNETIEFLPYLIAICDFIHNDPELFQLELSNNVIYPAQQMPEYQIVTLVLSKLYNDIDRLHHRGIFPYKPIALLNRLKYFNGE